MEAALSYPRLLPPSMNGPDRLGLYLRAYWLRPENALWMALRSLVLSRCPLEPPTADLCCGDGVFLFLHQGGRLGEEFDVFVSTRPVRSGESSPPDVFDTVSDQYQPSITRAASAAIDIGLDIKANLLERARCLHFYKQLIRHNANEPLPIADESLQTLYCNAAYWLEGIDGFLRQVARVLRPGARAVLHVKLDSLQRYNLNAYRSILGEPFLRRIAAARLDCWPTLASRSEWERRFKAAGLTVEEATPFITRTHAHVWDIGLRPLAPMLVRMANALSPRERLAVKRDWIACLNELLAPLCKPNVDLFSGSNEPAEIQYVLSSGA